MAQQRIDLTTELANNQQQLSAIFNHNVLNLLLHLHNQSQQTEQETIQSLQRAFKSWWEDAHRTQDEQFELLNDPKLNPFVNLTVKQGAAGNEENPLAPDHHTTIFNIINPALKAAIQDFRSLPNVQKSPLKKSLGQLADEAARLWDQPGKAHQAHIGRNKHLGYALALSYKGMVQPCDYHAEQIVSYGSKLTGRAQDSRFMRRLGNVLLAIGHFLAFALLFSSLILAAAIPPTVAGTTFLILYIVIGLGIVSGVEAGGLLFALQGRDKSMAKHTTQAGNDLFKEMHPLGSKTIKANAKTRFLHFIGVESKADQLGYQPVVDVDFFAKPGG